MAAVTIFDDVTERVKTQEALQESEDRLKMAQRIAHVGSWEYYAKLDRAIWSDELFRIFGMKPQKYGPTQPSTSLIFILKTEKKSTKRWSNFFLTRSCFPNQILITALSGATAQSEPSIPSVWSGKSAKTANPQE